MVRKYPKRRQNPEEKVLGSRSFSLGLNELTHPSAIKDNELAECINTVFAQNGVVKKRLGSLNVGLARNGDTTVNALQGVYDIGGNDYVLRLGNTGIAQKYVEGTNSFSDIAGSPTFTNKRTYILQGYGYVYWFNESDVLRKWDGSAWTTFASLSNPTTAPTLAKQGSGTGPRTYYYKYVFYNEIGNTLASNAASLSSMPDTLDENTWVKVTIPTPPAGVQNIGIFRGVEPGQERYLDKIPASQVEYEDKGQKFPDETFSVPSDNTTSGFHFKFAVVFKDTIVGITTEFGDDTLVFSGGLDQFDNFGISAGGGTYSWRKGDGSKVVSIQPYKEQLYVFKTNKTGIFDFSTTSGAATMKDLNLAVGAVSQDSIHPAGNDLRGWGQDGAFSAGNEPNFADVVRTRLLSARIQNTVDSLTRSDISKVVSVYFKNLSIWALPAGNEDDGNTIMAVYDERYVSWSVWKGMKAACFTKFIDSGNVEHLYYGDVGTGNMIEMFTGYSDNGVPIDWRIATKQFDAGFQYKFKTFSTAYLIFGKVSGLGTRISLIKDGGQPLNSYSLIVPLTEQGMGVDQMGTIEMGDSSSGNTTNQTGIIVKYIDLGSQDMFSIQALLSNAGLEDQVEFMGIFFTYSISDQPLKSVNKLTKIS
jgi:hypothetical protein